MNEANISKRHVVLGATGAMGLAVVKELVDRNLETIPVVRNKEKAESLFRDLNVEIRMADLMSAEQTKKALEDADYIYHCVGIPYTKWVKDFPVIQNNIINAINNEDAKLIYSDNLYMYGKMEGNAIAEDHPLNATSKKGKLRIRLAKQLLTEHEKGKFKVVIGRFPDFYGPNVVNGFTKPLFLNPLENKAASWIATLDKKHSLIYIEDAAKAMVELAINKDAEGQIWHVEGAEPVTGKEFITLIFESLDKEPKYKVLKKWIMSILSLFVPIVKELKELLNQWQYDFVIDGAKFNKEISSLSSTSHKEAIEKTLDWYRKELLE